MNRMPAILFALCVALFSNGQFKTDKVKLTPELREISGLESYNDSILIAINDGGNTSELFFIDLKGKILKSTLVFNATNTDWEDLAKDDKGNLYIADAGNNNCNRKDLCVWKLSLKEAYERDSVSAERIAFSYADQADFAPDMHERRFDSEGLYWYNDTLHVLTKNTSKPVKNYWDNGSVEYSLPDQPGEYSVRSSIHYWTGGDNRIKHQVTACDVYGNELVILTYGNIFFYESGAPGIPIKEPVNFGRLKQREALVILNEKKMIIAAERHPLLGGPYLYTLKWK
jgi:hypothetical protein